MLQFRFCVFTALVLVSFAGCNSTEPPPDAADVQQDQSAAVPAAESDDPQPADIETEPQTELATVESTDDVFVDSTVLKQAMVDLFVDLVKQEQPDVPTDVIHEMPGNVETGVANMRKLDPNFLMVTVETEERLQEGLEIEDAAQRIADARAFLTEHGLETPALAMKMLPQHKAGTLSPVRTELLAHLLVAKTKQTESVPRE